MEHETRIEVFMKIIKTKSESETRRVAAKFAKSLKGGEVVALYGDLGAGKTVWVKGMAKGLGIRERVLSPTFVFLQCHSLKQSRIKNPRTRTSSVQGRQELRIKQLCHVDAYRLKSAQEFLSIGIEDYLGEPDTVTVIEWAEKAEELLRGKKVIRINFEFGKKEEERVIEISN